MSILLGTFIVVYEVYSENYLKHKSWVIALFVIILNYVVIYSLPIIRGYYMYGLYDSSSHLGKVYNTLLVGHVETANFYPIFNIIISIFTYILNISPTKVFLFAPLLFEILFFLFMYSLSRFVLPEKGQAILATLASTAPIHGWFINATPNHFSNLYIPFVFFCILKENFCEHQKIEYAILLVILILLLPIFHVVPTLAMLFLMLSINFPKRILDSFIVNNPIKFFRNSFKKQLYYFW